MKNCCNKWVKLKKQLQQSLLQMLQRIADDLQQVKTNTVKDYRLLLQMLQIKTLIEYKGHLYRTYYIYRHYVLYKRTISRV
jgi:hypothetical protein